MNTKTALIILGVAVAIIAIIAIAKPKKSDPSTEPQIDPVTGEVILGTGGPDEGITIPGDETTNPEAPVNPDFPKTGFKPTK
ncbi:MAG: hypothetical protein QG583_29 [Patescibacteria group bacterium]|nr:hypothetical protein [Patescibacteria group bacterium]